MTRRGFFATLFGAVAARFARKPKPTLPISGVQIAHAYKESGHVFYQIPDDGERCQYCNGRSNFRFVIGDPRTWLCGTCCRELLKHEVARALPV